MTERNRLINLATRLQTEKSELQKTPQHIVHICRNCGVSSSFRWNFRVNEPTKTCYECGFTDLVEQEQNKHQEVA